ncbi:MAG: ribosomal-processing cysteine protease Prp [Acutalibacteraceae bacterium]
MIKVTFYKKGDKLSGFEISGHSGYAQSGEDIVCSAVSSVAYCTANTLTEIAKVDCDIKLEDGYLKLVTLKQNEATELILKGMSLHFNALAKQYKKYLLCKETTVKE